MEATDKNYNITITEECEESFAKIEGLPVKEAKTINAEEIKGNKPDIKLYNDGRCEEMVKSVCNIN